MISSLFPSNDKANIKGENTSARNIDLSQPNFPLSPPLKKAVSRQAKDADKLNSQVQQYMRETLKRIYQKSRNELNSTQQKPPSYERSSMIRELLINLENVKDHAHQAGEAPIAAKENKEEADKLVNMAGKGIEEMISTPQVP